MANQVLTPRLAQRILNAAGLDFHVLLTLVFRGWGILAGAITMVLLPMWLSPSQQGYYYTFASLLALQIFFELGLNQVIVQLVSHEAAHLSFNKDGIVHGDAERQARLGGIVALIRRWYTIAALLFAVLTSGAGWFFFGRYEGEALPVNAWAPAWGIVVVFSAINLFLSPWLAFIEGTGQVGQVARLRLIQSVAGYSMLWILLLLGANLWISAAIPIASVVSTLLWLRSRSSWFKHMSSEKTTISWRHDIFPLQWRIAVSWASGYFIFNLFTPVVFSSHGAKEAGRLGMAMSVFNAASTLGLSWINAKAPTFTMYISRGESAALNRLFKAVSLRSTAVTAVLGFTVVAVVAIANHQGITAIHRIASPDTLFWIACASVANTAVYSAATYMRAHREEPMLPVSVVIALLTIIAVVLMRDDVIRMMMVYAAICTCISLPWTALLLKRYRARHIAPQSIDPV